VSTTYSTTAGNIATAINGAGLDVTAVASAPPDAVVTLTALSPGPAGDSIRLSTTSPAISLTAMSGGAGALTSRTVQDKPDQPRNVVVQINFDEAMMPLAVSGETDNVVVQYDYDNNGEFGVDGVGEYVAGEWKISNQYRTIEFLAESDCIDPDTGLPLENSCGDRLFCLPLNDQCVSERDPICLEGFETTQFRVTVFAASLQTCEDDDDCDAQDPYLDCVTHGSVDVCQKDSDETHLPTISTDDLGDPDGAVDMAANSFDGNKNANAEGPEGQSGNPPYDQTALDVCLTDCGADAACKAACIATAADTQGDDYQWSFYINSEIDLVPPKISATKPGEGDGLVDLEDPINITFDKIMSSSTLKSGQDTKEDPDDPDEEIVMEFINLVDPTYQVGYWVTKRDIDVPIAEGDPAGDGYADYTGAYLNHTKFQKSTNYGARAGSGLRDIYQNCYKPSEGPECEGLPVTTPSCCRGTVCDERCYRDTGLCPTAP